MYYVSMERGTIEALEDGPLQEGAVDRITIIIQHIYDILGIYIIVAFVRSITSTPVYREIYSCSCPVVAPLPKSLRTTRE